MVRIAFVMVFASSLPAWGQQPKGPKWPDGVKAEMNLEYGTHVRNKLDLYLPKSDKPLPLVIWVHGGGWEAGDKAGGNGGPAMPLLSEGYAVASVNYRFSKHAVFPAQIEDVRAAVRFLRANSKKYNLKPDAFGAWGASAGGHLVALLAVAPGAKELDGKNTSNSEVSCEVQAVVDWFGPTDLAALTPPGANNAVTRLLGGDVSQKAELAKLGSPVAHKPSNKTPTPILILHGDKDPLVPLAQSEQLVKHLKGTTEIELVVLKGAGHGGKDFTSVEMQKKTRDFFTKHLKK